MTAPQEIAELRQIVRWLREAGLTRFELRSAQRAIRLVLAAGSAPAQAMAEEDELLVSASMAGVFLATHPGRSAALVRPGEPVTAGAVIGLLRVGTLLTPVLAPRDAVLRRVLVAAGETVGYGTPLFALVPQSP